MGANAAWMPDLIGIQMNRTSDAVRSRASQLNILLGPQGRSNRWAEGEEMIEQLSLSIFTIEADRRPVLAFAAKKYEEADVFFRDERVRTKLRSASSAGVPLAMTYPFCAFGWQMPKSAPATAKKPWPTYREIRLRSF
jgi:hypothetical protein